MPFDTALSGIRAASTDLSVSGNNIANASTTGFKESRAEFGDVYATSVLGSGQNSSGSGVQVQSVAQSFTQGSVAFTGNELDLAINGNGFFTLNQGGEILYTRAGAFGVDEEGYVTTAFNARLQGLSANDGGQLGGGGIPGDIQIETSNLAPRQTTEVQSTLNLDSREEVLQRVGRSFTTEGNSIGVTQAGLQSSTTTTLAGADFALPVANDFNANAITFDISLSGASDNNGTVSIDLDSAEGVPQNITTFNDLRTLAGVINAQIFSPPANQAPIDVVATAVDQGAGNYAIQFSATRDGEGSQINLSNQVGNANLLGIAAADVPAGSSVAGIPQVANGYPMQSVDIINPAGNAVTYTASQNATAATTASELNAVQGVSATANTSLTISNYTNAAGNMTINLNGVTLTSDELDNLADEINALTGSTLPGINAEFDASTSTLQVNSVVGDDLAISITSTDDGDSLTVTGSNTGSPPQTLEVDAANNGISNVNFFAAEDNSVVVGGQLEIIVDAGYDVANAQPPSIGLFQPFTNDIFEQVTINDFDPTDQNTYNAATSMTVYDSLGNSHVMTQFFVKQNYDPEDPTTTPNQWVMYVQIDGQEVGDPDTSLPPPENTLPTRASYNVYFNDDGSLNDTLTEDILISNWTPLDENGEANGAQGPQNVLAGGTTVIPDPPTSSNFVVEFEGTTQFGSTFSVNDIDQNGYTTGRLSGLTIDDTGIIFARFTNGESQILGQVVLADFTNQQGLSPVGNSMWAENFASGPANIGTPSSAALGAIQSGALEESNVDLSEQLVNLILAQRNFQASAKTIETANQTTQTIINLR